MMGSRCLVVLSLCCLLRSVALAESESAEPGESAKAEASAHFRRGVELYQDEAFAAALVEFQRAYDIAPDYRLLYNIAQTRLYVHDYLGAAQSYDSYLSAGGAAIAPERRAAVETALASVRMRIGRINIAVNREGAEVLVDDVKVGTSPLRMPMLTNVGRRRVLVRTADGASDAKLVDVVGGEVVDVSLTLVEPLAKTVVVKAVASEPPWSVKRKIAVAGWSAGGALLVVGAVTTGLALKARSDLDGLLETPNVKRGAVADQRQTVRSLALTTDVLVGTGAALALTGTLMWILDAREDEKDTSQQRRDLGWASPSELGVGAGLGSLSLNGRF